MLARPPGSAIEAELLDWPLFLVCWFPHSGGRWLNRGLLSAHPGIGFSEFFTPWLNRSVEDILSLDTTAQVHKARSMPELGAEFEMVVNSVEAGRRAGLARYFVDKKTQSGRDYPVRLAGGALPVGNQVGCPPLGVLAELLPKLTLVHLVRHPLACFASLKSRRELDGDASLAAAAWARLNADLRRSGADGFASRYHRIRYEDLRAAPERTLADLCSALGLEFAPSMLSAAGTYHGRNRNTSPAIAVTDSEREAILTMTAPERAHYAYADTE